MAAVVLTLEVLYPSSPMPTMSTMKSPTRSWNSALSAHPCSPSAAERAYELSHPDRPLMKLKRFQKVIVEHFLLLQQQRRVAHLAEIDQSGSSFTL